MASLFVVTHALLYEYPNAHPASAPMEMPLLYVDRAMPILPWTFLVYVSDYLIGIIALILVRDPEDFQEFVRTAFFTLVICGIIFFFCPTIYPRPEYPQSSIWLFEYTMHLVRTLDSPTNCFPSLHVALTSVCAWALRKQGKLVSGVAIVWSAAIFVSTLTTKQHYLLDVVGGSAIAFSVIALDHLLYRRNYLRFLAFRK